MPRLHSNEIPFPEGTATEKEGQEAEESKFGIKISADNPQSEWSTGTLIHCWLVESDSTEAFCLISRCQSIHTSVYFHGCFCSSNEVAGPGINPLWMLEILWQQLVLSFAVSKMELPPAPHPLSKIYPFLSKFQAYFKIKTFTFFSAVRFSD